LNKNRTLPLEAMSVPKTIFSFISQVGLSTHRPRPVGGVSVRFCNGGT
jgi:hypothetical protein